MSVKGKLNFIVGIAVGLSLALGSGFTSKNVQKIMVHYIPAKFMVDGVEGTLENMKVFTYNDSLYIPLRSVSKLMDKPISWEDTSQTVWLGKQPKNTFVYLKDLKVLRTQGEAWEVSDRWNKKEGGQALQIAGRKFLHGWYQRFWETTDKSREKEFLLNENFSYMEGFVGIDDYTINTPNQATVKIFVDDEEVFTAKDIKGGDEAIPFKINLDDKKRVRFYVETFGQSRDPVSVDLAEVKLFYKTINQ